MKRKGNLWPRGGARKRLVSSLVFCLLMGWLGAAGAQELTLTGHLTDIGGSPLNESVTVAFRLFPQAENGASLWSETLGVEVRAGEFVAVLGQGSALPADPPSGLWLEMVIDGDVQRPRSKVTSAMYAFRAGVADDVPGRDITPRTVSVQGYGPVIDEDGNWVGRVNTTDSDNDGFLDVVEMAVGTDPEVGESAPTDEDGDGIPDLLVGAQGPAGRDGADGADGADGTDADPDAVAALLEEDAAFRGLIGDYLAANYAAALRGPSGLNGADGADGADGPTASEVSAVLALDETFRAAVAELLATDHAEALRGEAGADGTSCSVIQTASGATITCGDGTIATLTDGVDGMDGSDGAAGEDGASCAVVETANGATVTCGTSTVTLTNGVDGDDGAPGDDGSDGASGADGTSCTVTQGADGATISCEDGASAAVSDGVQGVPGTSCSVAQTDTGATVTCGETSAVINHGDGTAGGGGAVMYLDSYSGVLGNGCATPAASCPGGWTQVSFQSNSARGCRRVCLTAQSCSVLYLDSYGGNAGQGCVGSTPASCPSGYQQVDLQMVGGYEDDGRHCRRTCQTCL